MSERPNRSRDKGIDDAGLWRAVEQAREKRRALGLEVREADVAEAIEAWKARERIAAEETFELRLEVQPVVPDTFVSVQERLREIINRLVETSGLRDLLADQKPQPVFAQALPSKEGMDIVIALLTFAIHEGPVAWPFIKDFLQRLGSQLKQATPTTIKADIAIGEKKVHVEGLMPEDAVKLIIKEYEVYFGPHRQE